MISVIFSLFSFGFNGAEYARISFSEESGMIFRTDPQFIVEAVMPNLAHFVPIFDHSMLDGVF